MQNLKSYKALAVLAMVSLFSISCNNDYWNNGYWYGDNWYYSDWNCYGWWNNGYDDPSDDVKTMVSYFQGDWTGTLIANYKEKGEVVRDSFYVDYDFKRINNGSYGRGEEITYKMDKTLYKNRKFTWHVDENGDTYLQFDDNVLMVIYYSKMYLNARVFQGSMDGLNGLSEEDDFDLVYVNNGNKVKSATDMTEGYGRSYGGLANTIMVKGIAMSKIN